MEVSKEEWRGYKNLLVWQKSVEVVLEVYWVTKHFPVSELYALTSQMKRSAISVPSNIAEGSRRGTRKEFSHFLRMAFGSGAELETQLEIAKKLEYVKISEYKKVEKGIEEVMRMLNKLITTTSSQ